MARCRRILTLVLTFILAACSNPVSPSSSNLDQAEVARDRINRGAVVLDVRTPEEYQLGHISGARNIPIDELSERVHELGENRLQSIVVYSEDGQRARLALNTLYELGFENVLNAGSYKSLSERFSAEVPTLR